MFISSFNYSNIAYWLGLLVLWLFQNRISYLTLLLGNNFLFRLCYITVIYHLHSLLHCQFFPISNLYQPNPLMPSVYSLIKTTKKFTLINKNYLTRSLPLLLIVIFNIQRHDNGWASPKHWVSITQIENGAFDWSVWWR